MEKNVFLQFCYFDQIHLHAFLIKIQCQIVKHLKNNDLYSISHNSTITIKLLEIFHIILNRTVFEIWNEVLLYILIWSILIHHYFRQCLMKVFQTI